MGEYEIIHIISHKQVNLHILLLTLVKENLIYRFWLPHWYLQTLLEIINLISFLLSIFTPENLCYKDDNYKILYVIKPKFDLQVCKSISNSWSDIRSVYNNTI
jgi:hypothetical protein